VVIPHSHKIEVDMTNHDHRWSHGRCVHGHDITDDAHVGITRAGRRFCVLCQLNRQAAMKRAIFPWTGNTCSRGHDVTSAANVGRHVRDGSWIQYCKTCAELAQEPPPIRHGARGTTDVTLEGEDEWMSKAKCRGMDPDEFFQGADSSAEVAILTCATCPVRQECGSYADRHHHEGLWSGTYRTVGHDGSYDRIDLIKAGSGYASSPR
jgi:hypothetical protein